MRLKWFMALVTLFWVGSVTMAAASGPTLNLGMVNGVPGQTVTVPVTLTTNGASISALSMDIGFNASSLAVAMNTSTPPKPTAAVIGSAGSAAGKSIVQSLPSAGLLRIGILNAADNGTIGDGVVANITFTIASTAVGPLTLNNSPAASDPDGNTIAMSGTNGTITLATVVTVPGAPTIGSVTAGNGQATVAFTPPVSNGGAPITGYTVTSMPGGLTATGSASPLMVTGLTNGTSYTFSVTATNSAGTGAASSASGSVVPAVPVSVPGAPTAVSAAAGNGQATVSFIAPTATGGSAITNYTVTATPGGKTASGLGSPLTVTGLTNGTAYTFTVTATNVVGTGSSSAASNSATPVAAASPLFSLGTVNGVPGQTVTVPVTLTTNGASISALSMDIGFNASSLSVAMNTSTPPKPTAAVIGSAGSAAGKSIVQSLPSAGLLRIGILNAADNGTIGDGVVANITFTIASTAVGPLTLNNSPAASDPDGNTIAMSGTNGTITLATVVTVPGAPTIGSVTAGNGQATVAFTPPVSNGGAPITGYTVTSTPGGLTATGSASPITVTGLTNGTSYTFSVTATNSAGTGTASSVSGSVVPAVPVSVPGAPTAVSATAGNGQATVSFSAPASNGGSAIIGYAVTSSPAGGTDSNAGATATSHTIIGLTNGTSYTFTVVATNSIGAGAASTASNTVIPQATVPGSPTGVTATAGNAQAIVTFTAPTFNGGSAITGYTVISSPAGGVDNNAGSTGTTHIMSGLTNGMSYTFTVVATNVKGSSAASSASTGVTPLTVPGVPTGVSAAAGNGQAMVSFIAPTATGGSAITNYTVTATPGGKMASGLGSPLTVTGLTNGTAYTFTVTATNVAGTGSSSAASNSATPMAASSGSVLSLGLVGGVPGQMVTIPVTLTTNGASISAVSMDIGFNTNYLSVAMDSSTPPLPVAAVIGSAALAAGKSIVQSVPSPGLLRIGIYNASNGTIGDGVVATITFIIGATTGGTVTLSNTPGAADPNGNVVAITGTNGSIVVTSLTLPGAPTAVSATAGDGQATVFFNAPTSNGGSAIIRYTVTSSPVGVTASGLSSPLTVTGLTNGLEYSFTVTATNSVGDGAASAASNKVTPASAVSVPGAPVIGVATGGNAQATVSFTVPATNGGVPITGYTVTSYPGGITASGSASPLTVTGLTNNTSYTFTVSASNSVGTGAESSQSNAVTPTSCGDRHWSVLPGGNASPSTMHIAGNLTINGRGAAVCDEVAVIGSGGNVVGYFYVKNVGQFGAVTIYGDSAETTGVVEGAVAGEKLALLVWDGTGKKEYNSPSVVLKTPQQSVGGYENYQGPLLFTANKMINMDVAVEPGIQITLKKGWNMVGWTTKQGYFEEASVPRVGDYITGGAMNSTTQIVNAFNTLGFGSHDSFVAMAGNGDVYIPDSPFNTLATLLPGRSYWVNVPAAMTITLPGTGLGMTDEMPLAQGWSQIGYWGADGVSVENGFTNIAGKYDVVLDESGSVFIPGSPFNTLDVLQKNKGYFIHTTAPGTLKYQQ